jgi:hypothetical protein
MMVKVSKVVTDPVTAWRIRDALATHPLLGGALAQIYVNAGYETILLEGWVFDEEVRHLALRLALRSAGRRAVEIRLRLRRSVHGSQRAMMRTEPEYEKPAR